MKQKQWIFSAVLIGVLGFSAFSHANSEDRKLIKWVGTAQIIGSNAYEITLSVESPADSLTNCYNSGDGPIIRAPLNSSTKAFLSLLIMAKNSQVPVDVTYTVNSGSNCVLSGVWL